MTVVSLGIGVFKDLEQLGGKVLSIDRNMGSCLPYTEFKSIGLSRSILLTLIGNSARYYICNSWYWPF